MLVRVAFRMPYIEDTTGRWENKYFFFPILSRILLNVSSHSVVSTELAHAHAASSLLKGKKLEREVEVNIGDVSSRL